MKKTPEQLQDLAKQVAEAWQKVQATTPKPHEVRNCPSDTDRQSQALRKYQDLKWQYTRACREANL